MGEISQGISRLGRLLDKRAGEHTDTSLILDFGEIKSDLSLITNTFPVPIPRKDYSVCRHVGGLSVNISGGSHGGHESGDGSHSHSCSIPKLKAGDRVLVAWVQDEAVVIDVIMKARNM